MATKKASDEAKEAVNGLRALKKITDRLKNKVEGSQRNPKANAIILSALVDQALVRAEAVESEL